MGLWQIDTDTLARSRFVLSPFAETFASLKLLYTGTGAHPGEGAWLRAHLPGYRAYLATDPVAALLVRAALGRSWVADFFCATSHEGRASRRPWPGCGRPAPRRRGPTSACPSVARSPPPWSGTTCPSGRPCC
ncbi:hypothetical protein ACFQQB_24405 [Nonomuraea rubra]|uniref:hypothetical protein n=1 Tax=Nonomuraea rubra TaxID=46180 RepID=UPI0036148E4A